MSDRSYMSDLEGGNGGSAMVGFLMGAVLGAGLALLLAPATGVEARRKLGETARRLGSRASDMMHRGGEEDTEEDSFRRAQDRGTFAGAGPGDRGNVGQTPERSAGGQAGEPFRSGGRREPLAGGRTPQPGTPGTAS